MGRKAGGGKMGGGSRGKAPKTGAVKPKKKIAPHLQAERNIIKQYNEVNNAPFSFKPKAIALPPKDVEAILKNEGYKNTKSVYTRALTPKQSAVVQGFMTKSMAKAQQQNMAKAAKAKSMPKLKPKAKPKAESDWSLTKNRSESSLNKHMLLPHKKGDSKLTILGKEIVNTGSYPGLAVLGVKMAWNKFAHPRDPKSGEFVKK